MTLLNDNFGLDEQVLDSILQHQKDKLLHKLNNMEECTNLLDFLEYASQFKYGVMLLSDMWAACGYNYKSDELLERLKHIRTTHQFGNHL